ncbi:MAG: OmpA family protein [Pseudomonadales bacterium]|nr:OmpA family protein [Pseudomonadales bacterium]
MNEAGKRIGGLFSNSVSALLTVVVFWVFSVSAMAEEEQSGPQKGQLFVSGLLMWEDTPEELNLTSNETGPGIGIGYKFSDQWAAEMLYFRLKPNYRVGAATGSDDADIKWLNALYFPGVASAWQPYITVGIGESEYQYDNVRGDETGKEMNAGLGLFYNLGERLMFRADARLVHTHNISDNRPFVSIGMSALLGAGKPKIIPDADGDGIADNDDQCPNTPLGRSVDANGCEYDGDKDGVPDGADACSDTPVGVAVDKRGCALDSDGDGVPDYRDDCPGSEAGAKVDDKGCYIELESTVTIDLHLEFDTNSAEIRSADEPEIQRVVVFLRQYPTANAVIEGHTDSSGSGAYNQALSERRAESVRIYLQQTGIAGHRLSAVGYGEDKPIASNDTLVGKQKNRRVSAVISGTHTVRQ